MRIAGIHAPVKRSESDRWARGLRKTGEDPIGRIEDRILSNNIATEEDLKKIQDAIKIEIDASVEFAENSEFPPASDLYTDNYLQEDYPFIQD